MCGFIGCVHNPGVGPVNDTTFQEMNRMITHRGPDDEGFFKDDRVQFGFRRLSIIDLECGHQPLSYENERYWIIFNGEIYNYLELREECKEAGLTFETDSDTETILAYYHLHGEKAVQSFRGMFGFVIWDKEEQKLFGARDQFGIKPFFYKEDAERTWFASEKKSLVHALKNDVLDYDALQQYATFQYVPEPMTMSVGIKKLPPGHFFTKTVGEPMNIEMYWKPTFQPVLREETDWVKRIQDGLYDSVEKHLRSDVPVGSFLSGGIDSSIIASIAKEFHPGIQTFSVGFQQEGYSEIDVAKETADKIGVENISYIISPEEYQRELPKIMWHLDDPLADPACVPLYFVAREARKHATVVLSGEGADELFGGYNIYREPQSLQMLEGLPPAMKRGLRTISRLLPEGVKGKSYLDRGTTPLEERFIGNAKMFLEEEKRQLLVRYNEDIHYTDVTQPLYEANKAYDPVERMQHIDMYTWLRGDILLKADKMTMAHSLELRVPFLDKEVFAVARELPTALKTTNGTTKYMLRKAVEGIVPDHVLQRRKLGFPVPIRHWLKDEWYDWARDLFQLAEVDHLFHKSYLLQLLEDHRVGKGDYSRKLWTVLVFILWYQVYFTDAYNFQQKAIEQDPSLYSVILK